MPGLKTVLFVGDRCEGARIDLKKVFPARRYRNSFRAKTTQAFRKRTDPEAAKHTDDLPVCFPQLFVSIVRDKRNFVNHFLDTFSDVMRIFCSDVFRMPVTEHAIQMENGN